MIPRLANFHTEMINVLGHLEFLVAPTGNKLAANAIELVALRLKEVEIDAIDLKLESTAKRIARIHQYLGRIPESLREITDKRIIEDVRVLRENYVDDLKERYVFVTDPLKNPRVWWEQTALFGEKVHANFSSARDDIREAGNCYATENNTACVIHLMRAAERGMRALARRLRVSFKYPLEYADWGNVIGQMRTKLEKRQQKAQGKTRGSRKETDLRFYSALVNQCDFFNEFWRVESAHARRHYNDLEALNVMNHVRDFFQVLAQRVKERPRS